MLGEDVQDQRGPVDDLDLDDVLQTASLRRRELGVADDRVGACRGDDLAELGRLAGAEEGRGVRVVPALQHRVEHLGTGGLGQRSELLQRHLGLGGAGRGVDPGQHDSLQAELAVLHLCDVGELGRQSGDTTQRLAVGEVQLLPVVVLPVLWPCAGQVLIDRGPGRVVAVCRLSHRRSRIARPVWSLRSLFSGRSPPGACTGAGGTLLR